MLPNISFAVHCLLHFNCQCELNRTVRMESKSFLLPFPSHTCWKYLEKHASSSCCCRVIGWTDSSSDTNCLIQQSFYLVRIRSIFCVGTRNRKKTVHGTEFKLKTRHDPWFSFLLAEDHNLDCRFKDSLFGVWHWQQVAACLRFTLCI